MLQLSGLPFSTAMLPVDSRKRRRKDPSLTAPAAAPANGVPSEAEEGTGHMEDGSPSGQLETRLIMDGLQGLNKLDGASGESSHLHGHARVMVEKLASCALVCV